MALGETLKQNRLAHGWTMQYVAERTHLMARVIEALEAEAFDKIPAPVYGRGFIRQYCALLEIDPQPLLDEYAAICANTARPSAVRPAVHDLPQRPLEPIHTGGRRTLPPDPSAPPRPASAHKLVEPAEASFTAVPKPEVLPGAATRADAPRAAEVQPAAPILASSTPTPRPVPQAAVQPQPAPKPVAPTPEPTAEEQPFTLSSDEVPAQPAPAPKAKRHVPVSGHAALVDPGAPQDETAQSAPSRSIFGPQHPVPDPPSPQVSSIKTGAIACGKAVIAFTHKTIAAIQGLSRPKVRRMGDAPEPLLSRRLILRMLTVAGVLIALTILVLAFRFVFRISGDAEPEAPITFTLRPVAQPPQPYFE